MTSKADDVRDLADRLCRYRQSLDIVAYWIERQSSPSVLEPAAFDPADVPSLLPFLYLLERDGDRLRYRVSGESVNSLFGSQHTGRYFDQVVPPEIHRTVAPFFRRVFDGNICIFRGDVVLENRDFLSFERVLLPVTRQGRSLLLGSLSLSNTATLRPDPPAAPPGGFHFSVYDIASGAQEARRVDVSPLAFRRFAG